MLVCDTQSDSKPQARTRCTTRQSLSGGTAAQQGAKRFHTQTHACMHAQTHTCLRSIAATPQHSVASSSVNSGVCADLLPHASETSDSPRARYRQPYSQGENGTQKKDNVAQKHTHTHRHRRKDTKTNRETDTEAHRNTQIRRHRSIIMPCETSKDIPQARGSHSPAPPFCLPPHPHPLPPHAR